MSDVLSIFLKKKQNNSASSHKESIYSVVKNKNNYEDRTGYIKYFPAASREWSNSVYTYNSNNYKLLSSFHKMVSNLLKSYFHLNKPVNRLIKSSKHYRIRLKRLSTNRTFISKPEIKHTNDKINITSYIYNGELRSILNKLKYYSRRSIGDLQWNWLLQRVNIKKSRKIRKTLSVLRFLKKLRKNIKVSVKTLIYVDNLVSNLNLNLKKNSLNSVNLKQNENPNIFSLIVLTKVMDFLKKNLMRQRLSMYYKRFIFINLAKYNKTLIMPLQTLLKKIYKKQVEFNLVNLKYFFLNSDILTEFVAAKLRNRKNRLLRVLKRSLKTASIISINKIRETNTYTIAKQNRKYETFAILNTQDNNTDILDVFLNKLFSLRDKKVTSSSNLKNIIFDSIKYKYLSGIRLEGLGRLTKRFTAARSMYKYRYKGSLRNIETSYGGWPSVMLRNNLKSNIQYTKKSSKTRNGSFGIKGWVSSK